MKKTGIEDYFIIKNNQKLRFGYTTGTCAAAATKAAARMLLSGEPLQYVHVLTPKGIELLLEIVNPEIDIENGTASCGVVKDGGDDPDVTTGLVIYSTVFKTDSEFLVDGGGGVGRVTKPGLEQPVGNAAINKIPRGMIIRELLAEAEAKKYSGGMKAVISVPIGKETAKKTFNPRLGILGGISILGTTGIVEPMSEEAIVRSIEVELKQRVANGDKKLLITLGNYGNEYLEQFINNKDKKVNPLKCSNFIGETIDMAVNQGIEEIAFIAHIGKFVKVAGGIMNTHSRNSDSRVEIMAAAAIRAGIDASGALKILDSITTDDALEILEEYGLAEKTANILIKKISFYLNNRAYGKVNIGAMIFTNKRGCIAETWDFKEILERITNV